ncbi:MAG TPA: M48 family metallopeptidase [Methanobacterium sp.]
MSERVKIYDLELDYEVFHRDVKYARLELKTGNLQVIMPRGYKNHQQLVEKHKKWIYKSVCQIKNTQKEAKYKTLELNRREEEFRELVISYVKNISRDLEVNVNRVYFRRMKSRWGSCSSRKNININTLLRYLPDEMVEYIVFHEIAHLRVMKHDKKFWKIIAGRFYDYKDKEKELKVYWIAVKNLEGI